ncbi:hypothetical protein FKM82_010818 [Ascaphus truei]
MWNAIGNGPGFYNCHGYKRRYESCDIPPSFSGHRSKVRDRARSRSPLRNCASETAGTELPKGARFKGGKHELQEQHVHFKRKVDELRRHQEKEREEWTKEKETLLKEITQIKAGENRGILLELKAVLEVIQTEQRKEEKKWSDLLLQFLNDRCGWERERTEHKHCISQKALRKKREEQKRLLEDTHTAAMELRRQLENNERNWNVEKMELLERFDSERKEWECQWKIMQKNIEELYQEVKLRRENKLNEEEEGIQKKTLTFSMPYSRPETIVPYGTARQIHQHNTISNGMDASSRILTNGCLSPNEEKTHALAVTHQTHEIHKMNTEKFPAPKMSKTENDTLNDALREIARVSEELCRYQEEIRMRSNCKRMASVSIVGKSEEEGSKHLETGKNHVSSSQISKTKPFKENNLNDSKNIQFTLCNSVPHDSVIRGQPLKEQDPLLPPWCLSWHLTNSPFPEMDKTSSINTNICHPHMYSTASKDKNPVVTNNTGIVLDKDGRCHVRCLCDVGALEEGTSSGSVLNSFSDAKITSPDMEKQNGVMSHNGLQYSNNMYPDMIIEGHSASGSGCNYDNTIKNGKLSEKIDEFNRIVFKTGKGSTAVHESSLELPSTGNQNHYNQSLCDCPATVIENTTPPSVTEISVPTFGNGSYHSSNNSVKATAQQCETTGSINASSYQNMLQEHGWKPTNLSSRPRSADSRSNYGVVEKLLRSYENKSAAPFCNSKYSLGKRTQSDFLLTDSSSETSNPCLEMLQIEQATQVFHFHDMSIQPRLKASSCKLQVPEMSLLVSSLDGKGFSRPARPSNQRLPSRWASRSPSVPTATRRTTH